MKRVLLQPAFIIATLFVLALITGGVYVSIRIYSDEGDKDALIKKAEQLATGHASAEQVSAELIKARVVAQTELERLNLFISYPSAPEALAAVREEVYENVFETVAKKIEALKGTVPAPTAPQSSLQVKIAAEQAHIQEILKKWEELIKDPASNSNPGAATQASSYAAEIRTDIEDLKKLVEQLTPENSGLTPAEIAADKADVAEAIKDIQQAVSDLGQTTVPPAVVKQQEQDTSNAQNHVDDLQHQLNDINNPPANPGSNQDPVTPSDTTNTDPTGGDSTPHNPAPDEPTPSENLPGTRYVPPVVPPDPNNPKLIEGQNPNE